MTLLSRSDPASQSNSQPWALQRQGSLRLSQGLDAWCSCLILHLWIIFSQPASGVLSGVISNLVPSACSCQHLLLWLQWFFCQSSYLVPVCRPCQGFVLGCPTFFFFLISSWIMAVMLASPRPSSCWSLCLLPAPGLSAAKHQWHISDDGVILLWLLNWIFRTIL